MLPTGLADTMDKFREFPEMSWIGEAADWVQSFWKQYVLMNPMRVIKYNLNNLSGDLDMVLAYNPKILKHAWQAFKDLRAWMKRRGVLDRDVQNELDLARRLGVIGSGWSVQEVDDVVKVMNSDRFVRNVLLGEKPNLVVRCWNSVKNMTALRENVLRLAAYRWFTNELRDGRYHVGASNPAEVNALDTVHEKAAKLSRELIGDYGNISKAGEWLRKRLIPFYAWMEINAPRYVWLMRNIPHEGASRGRLAAVMSKKVVAKGLGLAIKANLLFGAVMPWNMLMFPDEEDELGDAGRRQLHITLGRRDDGTIITLRFQGALSDALGWFGLEDWPQDLKEIVKGQSTLLAKLDEAWKAAKARVILGTRAEARTAYEVMTGRNLYPEPSTPRPIRDTTEHILKMWSLDTWYNRLVGKPGRGSNMAEHLLNDIASLVIYQADPGEQAYYSVRKWAQDWNAENGIERSYGEPTRRGNALYYYRQALKYGDFESAKRYLAKYYELGGTTRDLVKGIRQSHPLAGVLKKDRFKFRHSLEPERQHVLEQALNSQPFRFCQS